MKLVDSSCFLALVTSSLLLSVPLPVAAQSVLREAQSAVRSAKRARECRSDRRTLERTIERYEGYSGAVPRRIVARVRTQTEDLRGCLDGTDPNTAMAGTAQATQAPAARNPTTQVTGNAAARNAVAQNAAVQNPAVRNAAQNAAAQGATRNAAVQGATRSAVQGGHNGAPATGPTPHPGPQVGSSPSRIQRTMEPSEVQSAVRGTLPAVSTCRDSEQNGNIMVTFVIQPDGSVTSVAAEGPPALAQCVTLSIASLRFLRGPSAPSRARFEFVFQPRNVRAFQVLRAPAPPPLPAAGEDGPAEAPAP